MEVLLIGLYSKLSGDSGSGGVASLSTGGIHQMVAPGNVVPPYTVFQELLDLPGYSFTALQYDSIAVQIKHFAVDANSAGADLAGQMADRCRVLLTDTNNLSVSGKSVLYCRFIRSVPSMGELGEANRYIYSKGGIFEIWVT
jgi:hypothetical protein